MAATSSISNVSSTSTQLESVATKYKSLLVAQYVTPLNNKKTNLQARINALNTLKSKLKALSDAATGLTGSSGVTKFKIYSVESSNSAVATATASAIASPGSFTLSVQSLAKADTLLSSRITNSEQSIVSTEFTPEEQTAGEAIRQIRVKIHGVEVATISVTLSASDNNRTVLQKLRDALNSSQEASKYISAAVVSDTQTTSRLTILSKNTGEENTISLEDVTGALLDAIGITDDVVTNRVASTSSTAGYVTGNASDLNARFTLNGVDFTSGKNTVVDVLPGITLQLKSAQSQNENPVQFLVSVDTSSVQSNIQTFISAYNAVVTYIRQQTATNPQAGTREIFAGDSFVTNIRVNLQSYVSQAVNDIGEDYNALFKIGITQNRDGTLTLSNVSKLNEALKNNLSTVIDLFGASNGETKGIAVRIKEALSNIIGTAGQIESTQTTLKSQLTSLTNRITAMNKRVEKQAEQYKLQFSKMLAVYQEAVAQQTALKTLTDSLYAAFYY
ncbi:MAG: flagellar filament capping protein FliD [Bacteroidetes bacterium]|nr:flagellar filament capping protein FliD [Bacteroidota bacterium]